MKPKDFVQRSNLRGALALCRDWLAIVAIVALNVRVHNFLLYITSVWLIGSFQFALSEALLHEAIHYNLLKNRKWNDWLDVVYALPFFRTVSQMRAEHGVHHSRLGQPGDHLVDDYEAFGLNRPHVNVFWIWFVKPLLGYAGYYYIGTWSLKPWKSGVRILLFWAMVISLFAWLHQLPFLLLYWFVPFLWSCYSQLYWSEITDHFRAPTGIRSNLDWFSNFMHHNNGYHYTHHTYPSIPWHQLSAATRALCPDKGDVSYGFIDIYRSIKSQPEDPAENLVIRSTPGQVG
ncbi:MAG TPA: fatty acid desaturase [Candidatus Angelobacter sp.]